MQAMAQNMLNMGVVSCDIWAWLWLLVIGLHHQSVLSGHKADRT